VNISAPVTVQPQPVLAKFDILPSPVKVENTVNVPAQPPAPVTVENTVNVPKQSPSPVTVENTVNVPAQPVTLTMQGTTSVVRRDADNLITEIESVPRADVTR
jgi:hypothetical protein